jgi:hypothetical protein
MAAANNTLPSFVELMETLGIDPVTRIPEQSSSRSSPSSPQLLALPTLSPSRSRSSPSLRDPSMSRSKGARYSPYAPTVVPASRRGSVSSSSSSSPELERTSLRAYSASPRLSSPRLRRRIDNKLTVNVFGSSSDLSANTPISSFVRRKTPGVSPTSPTFLAESPTASPSTMPFSLPTLPPFFPQSASSDSFPVTPNSDIGDFPARNSPDCKSTLLPDAHDTGLVRRPRRTGIRISTPPDLNEKPRRIVA